MKLSDLAAKLDAEARVKLARSTVVLPLPITSPIPGGQVSYAARFGLLEDDAIEDFVKWQRTPDTTPEQDIDAVADFIAESCQQVLARVTGSDQWEALTDDDNMPVGFRADFAEVLGLSLPEDSKVAMARALWTTEDGTVSRGAMVTFALRLNEWMGDTTKPVEDEIAGGLPGGPK